jgi:hypothetical protein
MAYARQKNGRWYLCYRDDEGRVIERKSTARSLSEARKLAGALGLEMDRKAERQRLGLSPAPGDSTLTLGALCDWWLDNRCPAASLE